MTQPKLPAAKLFTIPNTAEIESSHINYDSVQKQKIIDQIKQLLIEKNAVIIAHYYVDHDIQKLAESTGGIVSDSLEMAKFGKNHNADTLVVVGVNFMGETAKILSPEKKVIVPTMKAECSLDSGCDYQDLADFCANYPEHKLVVYANTSAKVKALADFVVTSSIAVDVVEKLTKMGEKIIWAPDKHLGSYIKKKTNADMIIWNASCVVHDEFKKNGLDELITKYPNAGILVHPESPEAIIDLAHVVGSTSQLINAAKEMPNKEFIVATDKAIFYKMQQNAPNKKLIPSPTFGEGATCISCAHCPWMAMNSLDNLLLVLQNENNQIHIEEEVRIKAYQSTQRMFSFLK